MDPDFSVPGFEVDTRVKKAVAYRKLGTKSSSEIDEQTRLREIRPIELAIMLEDHFGIAVSEAEAELLETVGEAIELVKHKLTAKQAKEKSRHSPR